MIWKTTMFTWFAMIILLPTLLICQTDRTETKADKSEAPYFIIPDNEGETELLPLEETSAQVSISGIIADVRVTQVYKNYGKKTIEAIYTFPASTRAAVYQLKMIIGKRIIEAKIQEREAARQTYNQAIGEGRTATLLEQQRPNVFQMTVGNIHPGDRIKVELGYTELVNSEEKIYEFVYPTVVGPRYSGESGSQESSWVKNPYLHQSQPPTYKFGIDVTLSGGMPLKSVQCPSHDADIKYQDQNTAHIRLAEHDAYDGNRDFILRYRLAGESVEPGVLIHRGTDENFFLMMLQPPERIRTATRVQREFIFIVDVSGSMSGFPLETAKKLLTDLIGNLQTGDIFNVLLFAAGSHLMSEKSVPANPQNIARAIRVIGNESGGGGTNMLAALSRALALPGDEDGSRTIVIVTDGYVAIESEAFSLVRRNLGRANMFAFGIGTSVNRHLIEGIAVAGMGESFVVTDPAEADGMAAKFRKYISTPILTNITYKSSGFEIYDVEPAGIPDVLADRPIMLFGKWRGNRPGQIRIEGILGSGERYKREIDLSLSTDGNENSGLRYLWARDRIRMQELFENNGQDKRIQEEILNLGIKYNLLTKYTSFVGVDSEIRTSGGKQVQVYQPLPLPSGVSNLAIAGGKGMRTRGTVMFMKDPDSPRKLNIESQNEKAEDTTDSTTLRINEINVDPEIAEFSVKEQIGGWFYQLQSCPIPNAIKGRSAQIVVTFSIDSTGHVLNLVINGAGGMEKYLRSVIQEWKFSNLPPVSKAIRVSWKIDIK